jgi:glycosyltransferase involved in cell wall biosynthesis
MSARNHIIELGYRLAPALTKVLPYPLLRRIHRSVIADAHTKLSERQHAPFDPQARERGINVVASVFEGFSLKNSVDFLAGVFRAADLPVNYYEYRKGIVEHDPSFTDGTGVTGGTGEADGTGGAEATAPYGINLVHAGPVVIHHDFRSIDSAVWDGRYNIYYYIWELDVPSPGAQALLDFFDEIWAPSEFALSSLRGLSGKPMMAVPYAFDVSPDDSVGREFFSLPEDKFLFLCMYDGGSDSFRKNPEAVIESYKKAFPAERGDCGLVIKIGHPDDDVIARLHRELAGYENVYYMLETFSLAQVHSLMKACDAFVSLPRAEGFGLMMAEAMMLGTPVVVTNYSAHTEFMDANVACMVDYRLIDVSKESALYQKGAHWAEPDTNDAARHMRRLYEDREYAARLAAAAREHIGKALGMEAISARVKARVDEIYNTGGRGIRPWT